jgi:hypothetical protein
MLVTVITLASVSRILPWQNGQFAGRVTTPVVCELDMLVCVLKNAARPNRCAG